jgi:hypothetical protein
VREHLLAAELKATVSLHRSHGYIHTYFAVPLTVDVVHTKVDCHNSTSNEHSPLIYRHKCKHTCVSLDAHSPFVVTCQPGAPASIPGFASQRTSSSSAFTCKTFDSLTASPHMAHKRVLTLRLDRRSLGESTVSEARRGMRPGYRRVGVSK